MKATIIILLIGSCVFLSSGLPVTKTKEPEKKVDTTETPNVETALEYERYLKEVFDALESDLDFKKKLEKASDDEIRQGKIALELEYVNHKVRTKLDEIKRRELDRLRKLAIMNFEYKNEIDRDHLKVNTHLDHANNKTFEIEDLKKLIMKTAEDLAEADRKRREEFKEYEMQKQFEKEMAKQQLDEEHQKKFDEEQKLLEQKHKKHEKVHHPGNKAQLEEVWEKQDHMDRDDFNPQKFFMLHDLNSDNFLDQDEVKALFIKELDKVYQSGLPEDDMRERAEEMERMREHVFAEADTNRDALISFQEFIDQTKREEYNTDPEWQTLDENPVYSHDEYLQFERKRKEEIDRMIAQGLISPQGYYPHDPNAAYQTGQQHPSGNQQVPQMHYQNPQQQHIQQQQQYQQQQQQYQQHGYQQQPQYHGQPVQLNPNQVYQQIPAQHQQQQQQPGVNNLPPQQQPMVNNVPPQQPVASNNVGDQKPLQNSNIPQQQHPINNAVPNIPQKH